MLYVVLVLLFIFVFVFLGWRIWATQPSPKPVKADTYVCPRCNEKHCDCHKEEESGSQAP
jgi:hypothetical protein